MIFKPSRDGARIIAVYETKAGGIMATLSCWSSLGYFCFGGKLPAARTVKKFAANINMLLLLVACLLSGCATSRGIVSVSLPAKQTPLLSNGIEIYVRSVVDRRVFENNPRSPNIPSLDPSEPSNDEIKLRAVARKRNTFGQGLGDIILAQGQTVVSVINDSVRQALSEVGYIVVDKLDAAKQAQIVDVSIAKFWSWMNPGFWAITLSTEIETEILISKPSTQEKRTVSGKAADHFQGAFDSNWVSVMNNAIAEFAAQAREKLK